MGCKVHRGEEIDTVTVDSTFTVEIKKAIGQQPEGNSKEKPFFFFPKMRDT